MSARSTPKADIVSRCVPRHDGGWLIVTDTGRAARADICERLIRDGKLRPHADGLFADDSQTWGLA